MMNRAEFMRELEELLNDVSLAERVEALKYYNDYFDDAGEDNEDMVIRELGSPWRVAGIIKENFEGKDTTAGEFTERGYEDHRYEAGHDMPQTIHKRSYDARSHRLLLIIICLFALPIILPVGVGAVSVVFGVIVALIALFFSVGIVSVSLMIGGGVVFIVGLTRTVVWLPEAIAMCGVGLMLFAVGLVLLAVSIFIYKKAIPALIRWIVDVGRRLLKKGRKHDE